MARWLLIILLLVAGCSSGPQVDGMGHAIADADAERMAREGSALVEVVRHERYTAPPTVHVIYGKDRDGRELVAFVYTTLIRAEYTERLMGAARARELAQAAGFPADAIDRESLQVFQGTLEGRDRPIFWRLGTHAGFIWIDAETGAVLRRLDAR